MLTGRSQRDAASKAPDIAAAIRQKEAILTTFISGPATGVGVAVYLLIT